MLRQLPLAAVTLEETSEMRRVTELSGADLSLSKSPVGCGF